MQGWKIINISQCLLWVLMLNLMNLNLLQAQTEYEEELLESLGEKESLELLEELQELRENPVNINQAGIKELGKIPFLTQLFMQRIIKEREEKGFFSSLNDFKQRLQITEEIWNRIHPYLDIKEKRFENLSLEVRSRFQRNYSTRIHYQDLYPGSVWRMYQRIRISQKDVFNSALLIEKDPGETDPADHLVGFIEFENICHSMQLLLGTYYIKAGQGIVLWSPYGFSKGVYPVSAMKKRPSDIQGYKSTDENNFLTGAAVAFNHPTFHLLLFGSGTRLDASLNMDGTIKSFPVSGYHRTAYEKETKETVTEHLVGLRTEVTLIPGSMGITSLFTEYSHPVQRDLGNKNLFSFRGSRNYLYSLDFDLYCNRFNLFGEIAVGKNRSTAFITGCIYDVDRIKGVVIYRNFSPRFYSPHGQGFISSSVNNERGINFGFATRISKYTLNIMFDFYNRPWRTYTIPVPIRGNDLYVWITRRINSHFKIKCKIKFKSKEDVDSYITGEGISTHILKTSKQESGRLEVLSKFRQLQLTTRVELSHVYNTDMEREWGYQARDEFGFLFYQDVDVPCFPFLQVRSRWIGFKTSGYESRIYEFENDLPGSFTIPFLYGKGIRWYIIAQLNIKKHITFNVKYRETRLKQYNNYGNSADRERKRYLGLQADVSF